MEALCRLYKRNPTRMSGNDRINLQNMLIQKYKSRNTSRIDQPERDILQGTALLEALQIYESYATLPPATGEFVLRRMIRDAMSIENNPLFRNETHYRNLFASSQESYQQMIERINQSNAAGPSGHSDEAGPSEPVSVEFNRSPKTTDRQGKRKRSLNARLDLENEKRIKMINKNIHLKSDECPICMESLDSDICMINPCGHTFHCQCVNQARKSKNTCPLCRTVITELIRLPEPPKPEPVLSGSATTDGTTVRDLGEPEVNSFGNCLKKINSDLRYLNTMVRKAGR